MQVSGTPSKKIAATQSPTWVGDVDVSRLSPATEHGLIIEHLKKRVGATWEFDGYPTDMTEYLPLLKRLIELKPQAGSTKSMLNRCLDLHIPVVEGLSKDGNTRDFKPALDTLHELEVMAGLRKMKWYRTAGARDRFDRPDWEATQITRAINVPFAEAASYGSNTWLPVVLAEKLSDAVAFAARMGELPNSTSLKALSEMVLGLSMSAYPNSRAAEDRKVVERADWLAAVASAWGAPVPPVTQGARKARYLAASDGCRPDGEIAELRRLRGEG